VILRTSLSDCKLSCCGEARTSIAGRRGSSAKVIAKAITTSSDATDPSPSSTSLNGLDGVNFFLAGMQSGFGPFVAVLLADEKWTGGELLDASRSKRFLVALGGIIVAASAASLDFSPYAIPMIEKLPAEDPSQQDCTTRAGEGGG
jgi:hypothetical protein